MATISNLTIASRNNGFTASGMLDGISFNSIGVGDVQGLAKKWNRNDGPWATSGSTELSAFAINAVDIDWNGAFGIFGFTADNPLKTTGQLLAALSSTCAQKPNAIKVNGNTYKTKSTGTTYIIELPDYPTATTSLAWGAITGKPNFATVATSGSYNDLTNKPTWTTASGGPSANATLTHGGTFTVPQVSQAANGQVTVTNRTMTMPAATGHTTSNTVSKTYSAPSGKYISSIKVDSNGHIIDVLYTDFPTPSKSNPTLTVNNPASTIIADGGHTTISVTSSVAGKLTLTTASGTGWSAESNTASTANTSHTITVTNLTSVTTAGSIANGGIVATFTPTDTTNYNTLTGQSVLKQAITLSAKAKTNPTLTVYNPNSTSIADGGTTKIPVTSSVPGKLTLTTSSGTGWSAVSDSASTAKTDHYITITNLTSVSTAGSIPTSGIIATFTPTDTTNYNTLTGQNMVKLAITLQAGQTIVTNKWFKGDSNPATLTSVGQTKTSFDTWTTATSITGTRVSLVDDDLNDHTWYFAFPKSWNVTTMLSSDNSTPVPTTSYTITNNVSIAGSPFTVFKMNSASDSISVYFR